MFIVQEDENLIVYDKTGRIVYKTFDVIQSQKFNEESLVVITKESIDFVTEVKRDDTYDITVTKDTNFISALIENDLLFVKRQILIPLIDVYNSDLMNVLRLYQDWKGEWVYMQTSMSIVTKILKPTHLKGKILYGIRKGKPYVCDLEKGTINQLKNPKFSGVNLQTALKKFNKGVVN